MKGKERLVVSLLALFLFLSMSVGYAIYSVRLNVNGSSTFTKNGAITISSAVLTNYKNLQNPSNPTIDGMGISFSLNFFVARTEEALNDDYFVTYQITIDNDSVFDYHFSSEDFDATLTLGNEEDAQISYLLEGIETDEVIPSKETKTVYLTINMVPNNSGDYTVVGNLDINVEQDEIIGSLLGSIPKNSTGDLVNNTMVPVVATIINSFEENKTYDIVITNSNFELVNASGNPLSSFTIAGNSEQQEQVYLRIKSGARFASSNQNLNIFLAYNGDNSNMGLIRLTVPRDNDLVDITPPTISNVVGTFQSTTGSVLVTYNASDNVAIDNFVLEVYKDNSKINTIDLGPDVRSYTVNNLADGNYYFKVIVEDTSGLTAEATSEQKSYVWTMHVTVNINQGGPNGNSTINYGQTYSTTITANNNRTLPNELRITMGGVNLNANQYNYNNRTGALSVPNVTGDLNITGQTGNGGCVVEGTKVLLANGKYKNIEDIRYDDLLLVWNYETGKITKEYPIWIEKKKQTDNYTKITFSDNSAIGVVGGHAFFNADLKEFVNYEEKDKFKVGSNITKIANNKLKNVKVKKIELINKEVNYYFVASTRYWNIITNDFITTDGYTDITNLYPFDKNISWDNNRDIKKLDYKYLEDVLPYYLFKGFRAEEVGVLLDKDLTNVNSFKAYIERLITNKNMILSPIMKNNNRYWMVSNSEDNGRLVKEGSYYKLPIGRWYSTSENKYYSTGDIVQVWTSMYFEKR